MWKWRECCSSTGRMICKKTQYVLHVFNYPIFGQDACRMSTTTNSSCFIIHTKPTVITIILMRQWDFGIRCSLPAMPQGESLCNTWALSQLDHVVWTPQHWQDSTLQTINVMYCEQYRDSGTLKVMQSLIGIKELTTKLCTCNPITDTLLFSKRSNSLAVFSDFTHMLNCIFKPSFCSVWRLSV